MRTKIIQLLLVACGVTGNGLAQPYIDLVNVKGIVPPPRTAMPGLDSRLFYFSFNSTLPLKLNKKGDYLILSPFAERWLVSLSGFSDTEQGYNGVGLPLTYIHNLKKGFSVSCTFIARWNGYGPLLYTDAFQYGGAVVVTRVKSPALKYKLGLYYNREEFGNFLVPLVGIDWKINATTTLYGLLPGSLVLEKKTDDVIYLGLSFKSVTNSYNKTTDQFIRIDDNRLMLFADYYLTRHLVINAEAGHSIFRTIRYGNESAEKEYFYRKRVKDNFLLQASLAWRLRI